MPRFNELDDILTFYNFTMTSGQIFEHFKAEGDIMPLPRESVKSFFPLAAYEPTLIRMFHYCIVSNAKNITTDTIWSTYAFVTLVILAIGFMA